MPPVNLDEIVSRAIKQPSRSSVAGRRRGRPRVARSGHLLDRAGHTLAQPRQPLIAIVVTDPDRLLSGDPDWVSLIETITATCRAQQGLCALYLLNPGFGVPATLYTSRLDAVIVVGQAADERVEQIRARRSGAVLIESPATNGPSADRL